MKTQITEELEIVAAKHTGGHRVFLRFNDGAEREVDFGPFLRRASNPEVTAHRNLKKFKSFHLHYGNLMWGDYEMIFPIADLYRGEI